MLNCDHYLVPESLDRCLDLMEEHEGRYKLIAGATDMIPYAREARGGDLHFPVLIDVTRIPELSAVSRSGNRLRFGANTTFGDFLKNPLFQAHGRVLGHCADWVADSQIRHVATIGGNIVNASPAADGTVALLTLNATVTLASRRGGKRVERTMPLSEFVLGPGLTAIGPNEVVTSLECDALTPEHGTAFHKVGRRRSLVISVASAAGVVRLTPERDRIAEVRLALGAVGPVPVRVPEIEEALVGQALDSDQILRAAARAADRVASRSRQAYRRDVVVAFVERAVMDSVRELGVNLKGVTVRG